MINQTIRDIYDADAKAAGLEHVGGAGAYSEYCGDRPAWRRLANALKARLDAATGRERPSIRAAMSRAEWASM